MILYITYNDQPSGVYWSQVTDVVDHLDTLGGPRVRLLAFVSVRGYREARSRIHEHAPTAWVVPMVPKMRLWKWNLIALAFVCLLLCPKGIMARGVFATWMAQRMRSLRLTRKVCFDGRGAYAAEWEEYRLIDDDVIIAQFRPLEHAAIHRSDFRLAVSKALVQHWKERYDWSGEDHVVVPCTLGSDHAIVPRSSERSGVQQKVVLVYSGSTAGWQSFQLLKDLLEPILMSQPQVNVLFLSKADANNQALVQRFPGRVDVRWARPEEVGGILAGCDLGLMVREDTITNQVASPTKFAEYLAAGLPVLISEHIGDFSAMVREHDLGVIVEAGSPLPQLAHTNEARSARLQAFARANLTKQAFDREFRLLLQRLA